MSTANTYALAFTVAPALTDQAKLQLVWRQAELASMVQRHALQEGENVTCVPGLSLFRLSQPTSQPVHALHRPALCLIVQGAKHLMLADELYAYDASTYLVFTQDLPVMANVIQARDDAPYLCVALNFDPIELAQRALAWASVVPSKERSGRGLFVGSPHISLLDAVLRLVGLIDTPQDIAALAPLVVQEIVYRLLANDEGWRLAQLGHEGSHARRVAQAIAWLRERYAQPLRVDDLAQAARMSNSSLHHHFKAVTNMSPLQYQKRLRLYEARRLMVAGLADAATAGYRVGYESPSQFSREYSRLFGAPPARDLREMRERQS
jgi:AraC-like DNA-binding protein